MTHRSLSTPNSGLRVFSASLLSALLIIMPFVQMAAASRRSEVRDQRSDAGQQAADGRRQDNTTNAAAENLFLNAPVPKPAPEPAAPLAPAIVATKTDSISLASAVNPGDTVTYTVNIQNNGTASPGDDATNVQFSDTIDAHTTLVADSTVAAVSDKYNAIGNTTLSIPDGSTDLLGNDIDPDPPASGTNAGMTVTAYGATTGTEQTVMSTATATAQGGSVTVNANGSFTYDPPTGFEGTDTFKYRAADADGFTAITTVTITIAGMIWYVNNNAGACTSSCDGRLSNPFQTLAAFQAVNNGTGNNPAAGDNIFLYESATSYVGPVTLLNNQKFIGQDATASLASITGITAPSGTDPFPAMNTGGNAVTITSAANAINLGLDNTLRGFTVGATTGTKISGVSFGTLIVGNSASPDVILSGAGQALNLSTGVLSVAGGFVSVATTSSAGAGISLAGVADSDGAGGLSFSFGSTTVSGSTSQGILIGTTTADLNFGNTSVTGGTDGISLQNNSAGTRTFGTLTIQNNTLIGFVHAIGGGAVTVTGATTITNPGTIGISVDASTTLVSFGNANVTGSGGTGVSFTNNANANGDLTFADLDISPDANQAGLVANNNAGTVTSTTGDISTTNANAINSLSSVLALALNSVSAANSGGAASGISLTSTTGTLSSSAGTITGGTAPAVLVSAGSVQVTYGGSITQGSNAALVSVTGGNTSAINFNGGLSATNGTGLQFDNADGIYNFNFTTTLNGGDAGIDILNGSAGSFSFGGTTITNPSGVALNVDGTTLAVTGGISISGAISKNNDGKLIDFKDYDTGTATISGNLSCTSTCDGIEVTNNGASSGTVNFSGAIKTLNTSASGAVNLDNNDGGNVNFTGGGLDIDTTSGVGFNAINGGTVTIEGSNNTINSTNGLGLNISGTTIGANDVTFKSISAGNNDAGADPASGIVLNTTGSSGGLIVTGNNTLTVGGDASGGTIQNTTSHGISLTNTRDVSFTNLTIQTTGGSGIDGTTVTNFTFKNGTITGSGDAVFESNIAFNDDAAGTENNVSGVLTVTNNTLNTAFDGGLDVRNGNGTISDAVVTGNSITSTTSTATSKGSGIRLEFKGSAALVANLTKATITGNTVANFPSSAGIKVLGGNANAAGPSATIGNNASGTDFINIATNSVSGQSAVNRMGTNAIETAVNGKGTGHIVINNNNPLQHVTGVGAALSAFGNVTVKGKITNNTIVANNGFNSSGIAAGADQTFGTTDVPNLTLEISGNNVSAVQGNGILTGIKNTNGTASIKVLNNTVAAPTVGARPGIRADAGTNIGGNTTLCLEMSGNTTAGSGGFPGIGIREETTNTNTLNIVGLSPSPANPNQTEDYLGAQNPGSAFGAAGISNDGLRTVRAIVLAGNSFSSCAAFVVKNEGSNIVTPTMARALTPTELFNVASADELKPLSGEANTLTAAITRDVSPSSLVSRSSFLTPIASALANSASETGAQTAEVRGQRSEVKTHAADSTLEVGTVTSDSVRLHHALNSKHETRNSTRDEESGLRAHYATLSKLATRSATAAPAPMADTVTANIGTLPAGGSVTITFQVTVNDPPNLTLLSPPRVSNQGTVTADGPINVLTDDPETGTAGDATVTQIDLYGTTTTVQTSGDPSNQNDPVTFTATVAPNNLPFAPPGGTNPTGTVQFLDGATPITCTGAGESGTSTGETLVGGTATCTTSTLTPAGSPHTINANYSGDGNFDPSSGSVQQTVIACATNPVVTNANDSGADSLRQAILDACNGTTIDFAIDPGSGPHTILLTTGELALTKNVTIQNTSGESVTVSGNNASRVFNINPGKTAVIIGLTITGGNSAQNGGGILNEGTLTLKNSTVSGNNTSQNGAGIFNSSVLNVVNSTISGNASLIDGGGLVQDGVSPTLYMVNSTVSGNTANGFAGGLDLRNGTATILNSTITGNHGDNDDGSGGGAGGIRQQTATVTIRNTIVAGNYLGSGTTTANDIEGTVDGNNNLIGDAGTAGGLSNGVNGNIVGAVIANVLDTVLANNGGPTQTHRLITGSAALDAGQDASLPTDTFDADGDLNTGEALDVDQRGQPRVVDNPNVANANNGLDIGAYEAPAPPSTPDLDAASDTGASNTDNYTADNTPTFTIGGVIAGDTVHLLRNGTSVANGVAAGTTIQLTDPAAPDGTHTYSARRIVAGGASPDSGGLSVTIDTGAPGAPTIDLQPGSDSGSSNSDDITNAATRTFDIGNTENGATVELLRGGVPVVGSSTTGNGGTVQLSDSDVLVSGTTYAYTARQTDGGGNQTTSSAVNVLFDNVGPTVSMSSVAPNPTNTSPIPVTVLFNESVNGFDATDITPGNATVNNFAGSGANYTFDLVPSGQGTVTADIGAAAAQDTAGNDNTAATQFSRTFDTDVPTADVTDVTPDPRNTSVSTITIVFSEAVTGFDINDLTLTLDGGANLLTGAQTLNSGDGGITWTLGNLSGITAADGTYLLTLTAAGSGITDNASNALAGDATDSWVMDTAAPTVTINQALGQADPTSASPINFTVVFSEPVTGFTNTDVTFSGAGSTTATVTEVAPNDGTTYNVAISGMNADGTVQATVNVNAAQDAAGNNSAASTSTDNQVTFVAQIAITIHDATVAEPSSGSVNMIFTVSLASPAITPITVDFTTVDGTAKDGVGEANQDYTATIGQVSFAAGQQVKTIHVPVLSDSDNAEVDETFTVTLSNPSANANIADGTGVGTITVASTAGTLLISEFRQFGPGAANDPNDDFVEIYNNTDSPITVPAGGYGLFKMGATCTDTPILIGTIPAGTNIPARGHFLFTGPIANYSLKDYGGTNAAAGNALLTADLGANQNFGLFATTDVSQISSVNRFDAVGFGTNVLGACDLLREGSTLADLTVSPSLGQHSYFRKMCEWIQSLGCTTPGVPKDTNQNFVDFWLADTAASAITGRLGAPGPENLGSPIRRDNAGINMVVLDGTTGASSSPNRERNGTAVPNGSFGTMTLRYRVTNNTGAPVTRLRYRVVDISTAIQPPGPTADLRALTSSVEPSVGPVGDSATCTAGGQPAPPPSCTVTVTATTLETPPAQGIGGGYNSTLSSGTITTGAPLPNGQSILINFKLGVEKTGLFRFYIIIEALP